MLVEVVFHACIFGIVLLYLLQAIVISICAINIYNNYVKSRRFKIIQYTVICWWHLEPGQKHRGHVPLGKSRLGGEEFQQFAINQVSF